jgi:hypothetical protein
MSQNDTDKSKNEKVWRFESCCERSEVGQLSHFPANQARGCFNFETIGYGIFGGAYPGKMRKCSERISAAGAV